MIDLRSRRIDADYRLNKVKIEEEKTAKALVNNANNIINSVDGEERSAISFQRSAKDSRQVAVVIVFVVY